MKRLRLLTAGESHGQALVAILEGLPAGLPIDEELIARDLARRQQGYGRGGRMKIEKDRARILSGVRFGLTLGSPVALLIENKDWTNWTERMKVEAGGPDAHPVQVPRPGHADLAGALKYGHEHDLRNVLERASARETTARVAAGAVARALCAALGIRIGSAVLSIGKARARGPADVLPDLAQWDAQAIDEQVDSSPVRTADREAESALMAAIDEARSRRDTIGGMFEVRATGVPIGLGTYVHFDRRLDASLAAAMLSVPAVKAAEIGDGWEGAARFGSEVHDPIFLDGARFSRPSNHAGGLEGGTTNGEPVVVRGAMKPISTVPAALPSVRLSTLEVEPAHVERSDTCAVPAAAVVGEAMVALELADALLETFGGDTLARMRAAELRARVAMRPREGHVFLWGMMGTGKSTVGPKVAAAMSRPFLDLDDEIERKSGKSIAQLFSEGEPAFRAAESAALRAVVSSAPSVIALGGGALVNAANRTLARAHGVVVALHAPAEVLIPRLVGPARPMLEGDAEKRREKLLGLIAERAPAYAAADLTIDSARPPEVVAAAVQAAVESIS